MSRPPLAKQQVSSRLRFLLFICGCGAVALLLMKAGPAEVLIAARRVGWGILPIIIAPAIGLFLHTLAWRILFRSQARPGIAQAFGAYIEAQAIDTVGAGLMGEPLKVMLAAKEHRDHSIAVVAADNAAQLCAISMFFLIGASGLFFWGHDPELWRPVAAATLVLFGLSAALLTVIVRKPTAFAQRLSRTKRLRRFTQQIDRGIEIASQVRDLVLQQRWRMGASVQLHLLGKAWIIAEFAIAFFFLSAADGTASVWFGVGSSVATVVGTPIPGQLGAIEGTLALLGRSLNVPLQLVIAIVLLRRLRGLCWLLLGLFLARRIVRA